MYRQAIVTFIDILGFKEIVNKRTPTEIKEILSLLHAFAANGTDNEEDFQPKVITFSDAIIRIRPVDTRLNEYRPSGLLFYELIDLVHAQFELINHGILLRGGISFSQIYFDDDVVFGPGLIKSYEIESNYAKYPRVVLDPALISEIKTNKLLKDDAHSVEEESNYINQLLTRGDDGLYFVDYLRATEGELDEPEMMPIFLNSHRALIVDNAKKLGNLSGVASKYIWLAHYHNSMVEEISEEWFSHFEINREDLLISSNEVQVYQSTIL